MGAVSSSSYMEPYECSSAVERCLMVADHHGWQYSSHDSRTAQFKKGERFVVLHLARNGGITRVGTDRGGYDGPNRKQYAINYLELDAERADS
jgi:hypothetical protein